MSVATKQTGVSDVRAGDDHHGSKSRPLHLEISSTFRVEFVSVIVFASIERLGAWIDASHCFPAHTTIGST
jgi:hypothetical protein